MRAQRRGAVCQSRLRASLGLEWLYMPEPASGELSLGGAVWLRVALYA